MNPRLHVEVGIQAGAEFEIPPMEDAGPVWLGRGGFCKIRIVDPQLSRRHCQFTFENGQLFVEDLGSRNGTRVNNQLIRGKVRLSHKDHIIVGNSELVVVYPPASWRGEQEGPEATRKAQEAAYRRVLSLAGEQFGRYRLRREIFRGTSSIIFRAVELDSDRACAVKILVPAPGVTPQARQRFIQGARQSARLRQPSFVRVYKGGKVGELLFLAMELVEGKDLGELVRSRGRPLELGTALNIIRQVLRALQYVHEQGLVFLSVFPDNVLICEGFQVKLTDYDLLRPLRPDAEDEIHVGPDERLDVDPSFAAPELLHDPTSADSSTDVFGAGGLLYHMICAQPPFDKALRGIKMFSAVDRPSGRPDRINPLVPEAICEVVMRALSEKGRYETPAQMLEALEEAAAASGL